MIHFLNGNKSNEDMMMKSIFSDQYSALEYIYSDEVELVSINRPNFSDVEESSLKLLSLNNLSN